MQEFTGSYSNFLFISILSKIYDSWQAGVQVDIDLFIVQRQAKFEPLLWIPSDEILLVVFLRQLIIDDAMGMATDLAQEV